MSTVIFGRLRAAAKRIQHDALTVYFVARDPNTPIVVRLLALAIAAYAMSPIDLIPDFIPILGYLDDIILVPLGIVLVIKLTPSNVIEASRSKAAKVATKPISHVAAAVVIGTWLLCAAAFGYWVWEYSR
tara:strand:+ start:933 stop:1322 length:390 start_codon:yes stop_codon:yes gene_type:complete